MNLATLERATAETIRPVTFATDVLFRQYRGRRITESFWWAVIRYLFGIVGPAAREAAEWARRYYDEERARVMPGAPIHDVKLALLDYEMFADAMMALLPDFLGRELDAQKINRVNLRAASVIEGSGRWTIMRAIEEPDPFLERDSEARVRWIESEGLTVSTLSKEDLREVRDRVRRTKTGIKGWARVPTGKETCAWCIMLCSRGAAYCTGKTAGLKIPVRDMLRYEREGTFDPKEHMNQWHDGCDCKIVPVFDLDDWDGKQRADAAYDMWRDLTDGHYGKDAVRAFRRGVEGRGVDLRDYIK